MPGDDDRRRAVIGGGARDEVLDRDVHITRPVSVVHEAQDAVRRRASGSVPRVHARGVFGGVRPAVDDLADEGRLAGGSTGSTAGGSTGSSGIRCSSSNAPAVATADAARARVTTATRSIVRRRAAGSASLMRPRIEGSRRSCGVVVISTRIRSRRAAWGTGRWASTLAASRSSVNGRGVMPRPPLPARGRCAPGAGAT